LIKRLPQDLPASIFITMHIGSQSVLPDILSRCGALPVMHAKTTRLINADVYMSHLRIGIWSSEMV
jgi:CheB methylesterase